MIPFLIFTVFCTTITFAEENVKFTAVIYRHGDRTPVSPYPNDPWKNQSYWPVKFGQLTNIGKRQQFALGKFLRQKYSHLLSRDFDPDELYVLSTDMDRTLMSAGANLAGLYPPYGNSVWNSELLWQPIPIHTIPEKDDELLAMTKPCLAYYKEYLRYTFSKEYRKRLKQYKELMEYLTEHSGMKVKTYYDILDIYSTLSIESIYNFTLPNWTHSVYPEKMESPACYSFIVPTGTPKLSRLRVGPLLQHIAKNMVAAMSTESEGTNIKMQMYSAHDVTVASVLNALGMFDGKCPCYTSTVFIELIKDTSTESHYIRISYRNTTEIVEPTILEIPQCGTKCPVTKFLKLYDNLLTVNLDIECGKQFPTLLGLSLIIGLCIFISIFIAHKVNLTGFTEKYRQNFAYTKMQNPEVTSLKTVDI